MRIRPAASPLIAFLLLASAVPASAECAWVLWEHHTGFGTKGFVEGWQALGGWPDATECRRDSEARFKGASSRMRLGSYLEQLRQGAKPEDMKGESVVSGDSVTTHYGDSISSTVRYICLTDTIDPRGPKRK